MKQQIDMKLVQVLLKIGGGEKVCKKWLRLIGVDVTKIHSYLADQKYYEQEFVRVLACQMINYFTNEILQDIAKITVLQ